MDSTDSLQNVDNIWDFLKVQYVYMPPKEKNLMVLCLGFEVVNQLGPLFQSIYHQTCYLELHAFGFCNEGGFHLVG